MKKYKIFTIIILFLTIILGVSFASTAQGNVTSNLVQDRFKGLQQLLNMLYLLIWPFLVLAGKLLSNNFVYGGAFSIDTVLWQLWQFFRAGMNYFIGLIFIVSIFVYFFKSNSKLSLSQIFPKIVIASVVVNMSWFLFAVLIDLSTILLVSAGEIGNQFTGIISKGTERKPETDCLILPITIDTDASTSMVKTPKPICIKDKNGNVQNSPCIEFKDGVYRLNGSKDKNSIEGCLTAKDIDSDSTGMLFSLFKYMNLLFMTDNTDLNRTTFWLFAVKVLLMLALIIPFILLCIILVIRLLVLWVVIPLSPMLFGLPILGVFDSKVKDKLSNIIGLIFQPAYVVFMLSIGFVFIQAIYAMMPYIGGEKNENSFFKKFNIEEKGENEIEMGGMVNITSSFDKGKGTTSSMVDFKNLTAYISWIIANLLSIFLLWTLVFIAFKSNSFTKKISEAVDTTAREGLKSATILPGGQSVASLGKAANYLKGAPGQIASKQTIELGKKAKDIKKKLMK